MMRADGYEVSTSTVERALRRRGLLLPSGFRADRRSWSRLRKRVFRDPPRQRNRVWQMGFSEFETARGGIWRVCAVIDYASKYCLATTVTPTSRGQDALACLRRAVVEAERVLDLDDLRADRGWMDVVNADDFVIGAAPAPIAVVTDIQTRWCPQIPGPSGRRDEDRRDRRPPTAVADRTERSVTPCLLIAGLGGGHRRGAVRPVGNPVTGSAPR
jgi:hypothetical protein